METRRIGRRRVHRAEWHAASWVCLVGGFSVVACNGPAHWATVAGAAGVACLAAAHGCPAWLLTLVLRWEMRGHALPGSGWARIPLEPRKGDIPDLIDQED